jgi:hypothetical protein
MLDADAFEADVCEQMRGFVISYNAWFDRRKLKRRYERFVATKRAELRKLAKKAADDEEVLCRRLESHLDAQARDAAAKMRDLFW